MRGTGTAGAPASGWQRDQAVFRSPLGNSRVSARGRWTAGLAFTGRCGARANGLIAASTHPMRWRSSSSSTGSHRSFRVALPDTSSSARTPLTSTSLDPAHQQKDQQDDDDETDAARGVIAPAGAVGPRRQGTEQDQDEN